MTTPTVVSEREWVTYPLGEDSPCVSYAFRMDRGFVPSCRIVANRHVRDWGLSYEHAEVTELIVSEFVTNVIKHVPRANPLGSVTVWHDEDARRLLVSVHDRSKFGPWIRTESLFAPPFGDPFAEGGRGLYMAARLSRDMGGRGVFKRPDWDGQGKTVQAWLSTK